MPEPATISPDVAGIEVGNEGTIVCPDPRGHQSATIK